MNNNIYENFKKNSIGENQVQKVSDIKKKKVVIKSLALLLSIFLVVSGCALDLFKNFKPSAGQTKDHFTYDDTVVCNNLFIYIDDLNSRMYLAGLNPEENHTVEEYKKLTLTDQDVFSRYLYIGEDKTENIIKALGYNGWNDYLIKQNCVDENNEPDFYLWLFRWYQKVYDRAVQEKNEYAKKVK